ncbi:DUF6766 family protein [Microbispora siamensis]
MRRLVRENALALCFLLLFLVALAGQSVLLAIFLRERGSPQSKKVGDPHSETASTG